MSKLITFVSSYDGFRDIEELKPYPSLQKIPQWYKDIPLDVKKEDFLKKYLEN